MTNCRSSVPRIQECSRNPAVGAGVRMGTCLFIEAGIELLADGLDLRMPGAGRKGAHAGRRLLQLRRPPPWRLLLCCMHTPHSHGVGVACRRWEVYQDVCFKVLALKPKGSPRGLTLPQKQHNV